MRKACWILFGFLVALHLTDFITTHLALVRHIGHEANPTMKWIVNNNFGLPIKIAYMGLVWFVVKKYADFAMTFVLLLLQLMMGEAVIINNLHVLGAWIW